MYPLRPHSGLIGGYLFWTILSEYFSAFAVLESDRVAMPKINRESLKQLSVPMPTTVEQIAISTFLDHETAKIDALIAEQQRLIELLQEKRQAVISHAVTKGLNPDAPMKDSGIEWLGEVPEHWEVRPLKSAILKIEQGWSPQCESYPAEEGEWGVLKVGCVNGDGFNAEEQKALPREIKPLPEYEVMEGDILASRGNTLELVGQAAFIPKVRERLMLSDLLYRFRPQPERAAGEFLVRALRSGYGRFQIERSATGTSASMKKVSQGGLKNLLIALPPLGEQHAILTSTSTMTAQIDRLSDEARSAITLLQERRSALISAAVTGQIDVRGFSGGGTEAA
jgi:type I restriction enzyme S subunit